VENEGGESAIEKNGNTNLSSVGWNFWNHEDRASFAGVESGSSALRQLNIGGCPSEVEGLTEPVFWQLKRVRVYAGAS